MSTKPVLSPMNLGATCPYTGLSIPECCCRSCHLEQLRRHAPTLFEGRSPALDLQGPIVSLERYAPARGISVAELRHRSVQVEVRI